MRRWKRPYAAFALEVEYPEQPGIWVPLPEQPEQPKKPHIRMSMFAREMLASDAKNLSPDEWYNGSRGARVVMLAVDRAKKMLRYTQEKLGEAYK